MKKKFLFFVSLLLTGSLVACSGPGGDASGSADNGGGGNVSSSANNGGGDSSNNGGDSIVLPNSAEQAKNNFLQLALTQGFEITFKTSGAEADDGQDEMTVGYKNFVLWAKESSAFKKVSSNIEVYEYVASSRSYEFKYEIPESTFSMNDELGRLTAAFYIGYEFVTSQPAGYISSEKSVTYNGRAATEYTYSYRGLEGAANVKLVFDNETGITLNISGSASSADGSYSSGVFEVTSFKTGNAVTIPTLVKNSGGQQGGEGGGQGGQQGGEGEGGGQGQGEGGGQGEQGETSKFVNKLFNYVSNQNYNIFVGSKLALFQDGTFELSFTDGGALVVYLGDYDINETDTIATLNVTKVYKAKMGQYNQMSQSWSFKFINNEYVLEISASSTVTYAASNDQPMRQDIPDDPNGGAGQDDKKYVVTQAQWEAIVLGDNMVNMQSNFTARVPYLYDTTGSIYTTFEFDNGKVHVVTAGSGFTTEQYYQFTSNESGYLYAQDSYDAWVKQQAPRYLNSFNDEMGLLPVPFSSVSYSSELHCYSCSTWVDRSSGTADTYSAIRFYFENGNLIKMTYNHWSTNYQHVFSNYGLTSVTIPQEGGGNHPTQDQLDALVSNNVYVYNGALDMDQKYNDTQLNGFFAGNKVSFFADKSFEIVKNRVVNYQTGETSEHVYVAIGEYKVEEATATKPDDNYIVLDIKKLVIDGVLEQDNIFESVRIRVTPKEDKVTILEDDYNAEIYTYYKKDASLTPTHVQYTEKPDNPPQPESKWPAEDIAAKLQQLGFNTTVPALPSDYDPFVSKVDVDVSEDNSELRIVVTSDNANYASVVFAYYYSSYYGNWTLDTTKTDFGEETGSKLIVFVSSDADLLVKLYYEDGATEFKLTVSKNLPDPFPAEDIATFFRKYEINATFPDLQMDNVTFHSFKDEGNYFTFKMRPLGDNTIAAIMQAVHDLLLRGGLKVFYASDDDGTLYAQYVDADLQYSVFFVELAGDVYFNVSVLQDYEKEDYAMSYPEKFMSDIVPAGVRDQLPSFAVDGATYMGFEDYDCYSLLISMQSGMSANRSIRTLKERLTSAGFTPNEEGTSYVSLREQIIVSISAIDDKLITIEIQFIYEEQYVEYTLISDDGWNFNNDEAQVCVYLWDNKGNYYWELVEFDEENHTITLNISDCWVGCKVVRFASEVEDFDWNQHIHSESDDITLDGQGGEIHFTVHDRQ